MQLDTILIITIIHFSLRLPHIQHVPKGVDAHFHLLVATKFKKGHPPKFLDKFVIGDDYTYPPLLPFLLSLIPERFRPRMLFALGVLPDYFLALFCYGLALQYVPEIWALAAAVVCSIMPTTYLQSVSESPRSLGALLYSLSILLLSQRGILETALAAVTIALTLLSHKMAAQTLLLTCLLLLPFLYAANSLFPLPLLLGLVLALLVTKGGYAIALKDHVKAIGFYVKHGSWDKKKKRLGSPLLLAKSQPYFYIPMIGLLLYPQVFLDKTSLLLAWYTSILLIFLFWLWGDGQRYLVYSAIPTSILSVLSVYEGANALLIGPALAVSAGIIGRSISASSRLPILPDFTKIRLPDDSVTLVMPSSLTYVSARYLNGRILVGGGSVEGLVFELETLPRIISTSPDKLLEYPITHMLLGSKHQDFVKPFADKFEATLETNGYVLYNRK